MENVVGIICEYDPFHRGHARQFALIKEQLPDAVIVCLMSGTFTQRGMPALFPPAFRARAALKAGAAMVLELPCAYAVRDAENFASGAVNIIHRIGFISRLSFGAETANIQPLYTAAHIMEAENGAFRDALKAALSEGKPYVAAQAAGLAAAMCTDDADEILSKPNNILGICYLRAIKRLHSNITPLPVVRNSDYHSPDLADTYPSASAVRKAYLAGDLTAAQAACGYSLENTIAHRPEALDTVLLNALRSLAPDALRQLPDCSEGLENRLLKYAAMATSREKLLELMKTKRYTRARLNRLLTHAMLDMRADMLSQYCEPSYVRLLGFRKEYESVLSLFNQSDIPLIAKASDGDLNDPLYRLDERAYDLWALGAQLPAGLMFRQQIVIE
ncbi:MAG TPA: nucleotidyltransferase family protein [Candidatus Limiplasma sp.]|nr:nucleotidyltransferase family protein [Candidatus Limiplasma sp.]HRX08680.1 nucleotidyltransferase family protein [Candidatus Limiplasma sp.]